MFTIDEAKYNASSGQIKLKVKNVGTESMYNFTVDADNGTMIVNIPASSPAATYRLGPGQTQYVIANGTASNITNIDKVAVLLGSCPGYAATAVKVTYI
jgi:hypothetical protein